MRRLVASAMSPTTGGEDTKPTASAMSPPSGRFRPKKSRQLIGAVHGRGHQRGNAEACGGEARDGAGHTGKRKRGAHACGGDESSGPYRALAEPVDEPVPERPPDELEYDHRDVTRRRERTRRAEAVTQIDSGPGTCGVFDHRP